MEKEGIKEIEAKIKAADQWCENYDTLQPIYQKLADDDFKR
jgi:hypothetical protein